MKNPDYNVHLIKAPCKSFFFSTSSNQNKKTNFNVPHLNLDEMRLWATCERLAPTPCVAKWTMWLAMRLMSDGAVHDTSLPAYWDASKNRSVKETADTPFIAPGSKKVNFMNLPLHSK